MAFPLTGSTSGTIQRGYMIWATPGLPLQYGSALATVHYLYNPSTVASDYNIAERRAQAQPGLPQPRRLGETGHPAEPDRAVVADVRPDVRAVGQLRVRWHAE